jgi:WNK lysine deficient protein kinase
MVAELDITDHDVTRIAEMIDGEVSLLVPGWKLGPGIEETSGLCENCKSNVSSCGSLLDYLSYKNPGKPFHCSRLECAALHGRFEEITYQVEGSEEQCVTEGPPALSSSHSDGIDLSSQTSLGSNPEENEQSEQCNQDENSEIRMQQSSVRNDGDGGIPSVSDDFEKEIHQELRWLKAKYQLDLTEYKTKKFEELTRLLHQAPHLDIGEHTSKNNIVNSIHLATRKSPCSSDSKSNAQLNIRSCRNSYADLGGLSPDPNEVNLRSSPELMFTAKGFYGVSLQSSLPRASSLPVDAVDI